MPLVDFIAYILLTASISVPLGYYLGKAECKQDHEQFKTRFMCCMHCDPLDFSDDSQHIDSETGNYVYDNHLAPCTENDCDRGTRVSTGSKPQGYRYAQQSDGGSVPF